MLKLKRVSKKQFFFLGALSVVVVFFLYWKGTANQSLTFLGELSISEVSELYHPESGIFKRTYTFETDDERVMKNLKAQNVLPRNVSNHEIQFVPTGRSVTKFSPFHRLGGQLPDGESFSHGGYKAVDWNAGPEYTLNFGVPWKTEDLSVTMGKLISGNYSSDAVLGAIEIPDHPTFNGQRVHLYSRQGFEAVEYHVYTRPKGDAHAPWARADQLITVTYLRTRDNEVRLVR